jgi:hypothetical protein
MEQGLLGVPDVRRSALVIGCLALGCGSSWPDRVANVAVARVPRGTIDVLPLDLELWTEPGFAANLEQVRGTAEATIANSALDALVHRG